MKNKLKFALVYGSTRKKRLGIRFVKYLANQILKNISKNNINKAFFDMNGQISIILMATFITSTIL